MRDPTDTPSREPPESPPRRTFLKLAVLGGGAALAVTKLGCTTATAPGAVKPDFISTGVLVTRRRGGTVKSATDQNVYTFDVSATYKLAGQQIAFDTIRITGRAAAGGRAKTIAVSRKSDLRGTLNASGCFNITGGANVNDGVAGFYSARIHLDGCVVSNAVPLLRTTIVRPASTDATNKRAGSAVISIS